MMNRSMKWLALCLVLGLICNACQTSSFQEAKSDIPEGMSRSEAIQILSEKAWYSVPCPRKISIDDLFFFGSHEYDKAEIVIVTSQAENSETHRVVQVSTFESYAWHTAYADCIDRSKFEG